jgi:hypothetical protein
MRYMTHAALGALLSTVLCSTNFGTTACAAEEKPWWHLGMGKDATTEPAPSVTPAPTMTPAMPDTTKSPWKSMSDGTKNAWHKTVDWVTPGDGSDVAAVKSEPRVSWWDRMWGGEEEQGPETVTEWMAQDRLDP